MIRGKRITGLKEWARSSSIECAFPGARRERPCAPDLLRVIKAVVHQGHVYSGLLIRRTYLINF